MSAYVVDDVTINQIVSFLSRQANRESWWKNYSPLAKLNYNLGTDKGDAKLANDLFNLNVESVCQRYSGDDPDSYTFTFNYEISTTIFEAIKSIGCLMHQSCEGDCMERPLYQALERVKGMLAMEVVETLPQYEAANWG